MTEDLNLNLLRHFYVLATSKSFLEASQKLHISQPAVSKSIKQLETLLDTKLFYRTSDGVEITNEGLIFFQYIEKTFSNINVGFKVLDSQKKLESGKLIIGTPSHIASFYLLDKIQSFKKNFPNISIQIISSSTKELLKALENNKLDFIIDTSPLEVLSKQMKLEILDTLETCFISKNKVTINSKHDIKKYPIILPIKESSMRKVLDKELKKNDIIIKPEIEVETTDLIISSVKRELGIGYVIARAADREIKSGNINKVNYPIDLPKINLNLVYNDNCLTYASRKFIKYYIKK